jgi:hypothetical protein
MRRNFQLLLQLFALFIMQLELKLLTAQILAICICNVYSSYCINDLFLVVETR